MSTEEVFIESSRTELFLSRGLFRVPSYMGEEILSLQTLSDQLGYLYEQGKNDYPLKESYTFEHFICQDESRLEALVVTMPKLGNRRVEIYLSKTDVFVRKYDAGEARGLGNIYLMGLTDKGKGYGLAISINRIIDEESFTELLIDYFTEPVDGFEIQKGRSLQVNFVVEYESDGVTYKKPLKVKRFLDSNPKLNNRII